MKTNKIIITSLLLAIGLILHQITPGIFLGSALIIFGLPAPFLILFVSVVIPTSVINSLMGVSLHKLIISNPVINNKFISYQK